MIDMTLTYAERLRLVELGSDLFGLLGSTDHNAVAPGDDADVDAIRLEIVDIALAGRQVLPAASRAKAARTRDAAVRVHSPEESPPRDRSVFVVAEEGACLATCDGQWWMGAGTFEPLAGQYLRVKFWIDPADVPGEIPGTNNRT